MIPVLRERNLFYMDVNNIHETPGGTTGHYSTIIDVDYFPY